jgi:hypothetical protein
MRVDKESRMPLPTETVYCPQDGADIRGVHHEGMVGDGQHCGHGINREYQVDQFNRHHRKEEACLGVVTPTDGPFRNPASWSGRCVGLLFCSEQPQRRNDQQGAEEVLNPGKSFQQRDAGKNEHSAHDDGAHDPQQQGLSLCGGAKAEGTKHQQENKKIVDAEGQFDQVAGRKLKPCLASLSMANPNSETRGERQQKQDKEKITTVLGRRLPATENGEVDHNQDQHYDVETYPVSDRSAIEHYPMLAYDAPLEENRRSLHYATLPFVIPSVAEGSAVRLHPSPIPRETLLSPCHPDRRSHGPAAHPR